METLRGWKEKTVSLPAARRLLHRLLIRILIRRESVSGGHDISSLDNKPEELEEAISTTLERMCRYVKKLQEVPSNKMKAYVVLMVENVCRNRLRKIIREREQGTILFDDSNLYNADTISVDPYETLFDYADAKTLLASFRGLSQRDQELIWMRHVEKMDYPEIAGELRMSAGAVRTALSRAKNRLEEIARKEGIANAEKQS